jgi:hypothetical protein
VDALRGVVGEASPLEGTSNIPIVVEIEESRLELRANTIRFEESFHGLDERVLPASPRRSARGVERVAELDHVRG